MIAVKQQQAPRFYEFGPFRVDTVKCALLRDGRTVPLSAKAFEVLLVLLQHPGQVLEKDELLKEIWCDTLVEENNLARQISALRKTLDEHPNEHQYILTVPGRGYRFVANVEQLDSERERPSLEALDGLRGNAAVVQTEAYLDQSAAVLDHAGKTSRSEVRRYGLGLRVASAILGVLLLATVVVTALIRETRPVNGPPPQPRLWQLTSGAGLESEPTWSPDGNLLAYSSDRSGNFDIWVRPVGEGNPVQVTTSPAHDWQPDWAPTGNRLVFRSERDGGGLYVMPVLGGNERKVASFGYAPRWSPDGSQILFYSSLPQINTAEIPKVYVVGLDGQPPREVLARFQTDFNALRVAWHPDGRRLSVWGDHRPQGWSFWTVPLDGGAPAKSEMASPVSKRLTQADVSFTNFQWSSSGRAVYFEGVTQSVRNIWKVEVDPQTLRWIGGPERLTTGTGKDRELAVSRDGKKLAFTVRTEHTRLWSLPFDAASGRIKGAGQPITEVGVNASFPDLSSDGQRLVFRVQRAGKEELREKTFSDGHERVLVSDDFSRQRPRWSRDGKRLTYLLLRTLNPERTRIERCFVTLAVGSRDEEILTTSEATFDVPYDWSADGKWILVSSDRKSQGRRALDLFPIEAAPHAETQMRPVTSDPEQNLYQARFSNDDRWISFIAAKAIDAGISTIYVVPATGGEWKRITEGKYFDDKPRWSPDGKRLYFISNRTGFFNVWGISFDSASGQPVGEPFRVTNFESPGQMILNDVRAMEMTLAADRLVLPLMEVTGDVWILENLER